MQPRPFEISFPQFSGDAAERTHLIRVLLAISGLLGILHLVGVHLGEQVWQLERTFHMARETNVPQWFSGILWALTGLAAFACAKQADSKKHRRVWNVTAVCCFFLSCDEVAMLHESVNSVIKNNLLAGTFVHDMHSTWPLILGPAVALALYLIGVQVRECLRGSPAAARLALFGVVVFFTGAAAMDLTLNIIIPNESLRWLVPYEVLVEEWLEMIGVVMLLAAFMQHENVLKIGREEVPHAE